MIMEENTREVGEISFIFDDSNKRAVMQYREIDEDHIYFSSILQQQERSLISITDIVNDFISILITKALNDKLCDMTLGGFVDMELPQHSQTTSGAQSSQVDSKSRTQNT